MIPTPEMIEAARTAWKDTVMQGGSAETATEYALTAALPLLPGEPICHLVWRQARIAADDVQDYYEVARPGDKSVDGSEPFPVYAAPSPLPVAVKIKQLEWSLRSSAFDDEWKADTPVGRYEVGVVNDRFIATLRLIDGGQWGDSVIIRHVSADEAKAAAQADYESRIRSALSSPVGGMDGNLANALTMTGCESEEDLIDMANVGQSLMAKIDLYTKAPSLIENWSPADDPAEIVGDLYNRLEEALSPIPASDIAAEARREERELCNSIVKKAWGDNISVDAMAEIAALREEIERLRKALAALDNYWTLDFPDGPDGDVTYRQGWGGKLADDTVAIWKQVRSALSKQEETSNG